MSKKFYADNTKSWREEILLKPEIMEFIPRYNYILVDPDPDRNVSRIKGPNGELNLILDTTWSKEHNSQSGLLVKKPLSISKDLGADLLDELNPGDRIYFHFNSIEIAMAAGLGVYDQDGHWYAMVNVELCYCAQRDSEIFMLGDNLLTRPVIQKDEDITTKSGLITASKKAPRWLEGIVAYANKKSIVKENDHIYYIPDADIPLKVDGMDFYRQKDKYCMARIYDNDRILTCKKCGTKEYATEMQHEVKAEYRGESFYPVIRFYTCDMCDAQNITPFQQRQNIEAMKRAVLRRHPDWNLNDIQ